MIMDRVEYSQKLADLIINGGYCKVKKETLTDPQSEQRSYTTNKIQKFNSTLQQATTHIRSSKNT